MNSKSLSIKDAEKILFPKGLCNSTLNNSRCIIPAIEVVDNKGFCEYHAESVRNYNKLWDLLDKNIK